MATPMLEQYFSIKEQYPDAILFFRLGDFYEMFGDDAKVASKVLEITLTSRDAGKDRERLPMCGVPHHAAAAYLEKLIKNGFKVAICEQLQDPKEAKGVVERDVVRVVTPATYMEGNDENYEGRYLAAVTADRKSYGLSLVDLSTGDFRTTVIDGLGRLEDELFRIQPAELLAEAGAVAAGLDKTAVALGITLGSLDHRLMRQDNASRLLLEHFEIHTLDAFGLKEKPAILSAAGALQYLISTQKNTLAHIRRIRTYAVDDFMRIDGSSLRNLEVFHSLGQQDTRHSLFGVVNRTTTNMGARMLRRWLQQPLLDVLSIKRRQDALKLLIRDGGLRHDLRTDLQEIQDLERLLSRLVSGSGTPRDLRALATSLQKCTGIVQRLEHLDDSALIAQLKNCINPIPELVEPIEAALVEEPPLSSKEGGIIQEGFNEELDSLRCASREGKNWIRRLEAEERERTGIKSLKVGYNKVFGYYIEVTKANAQAVPETYQRKQTLANAERFITPELKEKESLILGADERMNHLEYQLFVELRDMVKEHIDGIQMTAESLATVDVLQGLADVAQMRGYTCPILSDDQRLEIKDGRHPVIEALQPDFVPNDLHLDENERIVLLTGPNMAGKSTFLRQCALLVLLAQVGSYVPATDAQVGVVDRIFTRIGAGDDLSTGQSTFMVECAETAHLLHNSTARSLIILDELGRGTSTFDGMAIAQGVIEHIHDQIGARTLFSTHYHELTKLQETLSHLVTYRVEVEESRGQVFFLHKVVRGNADRSYGINVAKMAGIPKEIIRRSQDLLYQLEAGQKKPLQLDLFESTQYAARESRFESHAILEQLESINPQEMTPLEALQLLFRWKDESHS